MPASALYAPSSSVTEILDEAMISHSRRIGAVPFLCMALLGCDSPITRAPGEPEVTLPAMPAVGDPDVPVEGIDGLVGLIETTAPPAPPPAPPGHVTLINFADDESRLTRFHLGGNNLDAHDGEIERFGDLYYLYGVAYGCGFEWRVVGSPFCGIKVYTSPDLVEWTYAGLLFDHLTFSWQLRCGGTKFGCFRPHVAFNRATNRYVLWLNTYDVGVGYRVFESSSPTGPFIERELPKLAATGPRADTENLNYNGDHNLFVDDDGAGYLVYTDWRSRGDIVVERLTASYLSGTGRAARLGLSYVEAPAMFRRGDRYYITVSDPACPYCRTGTSYVSAPTPMGPWSAPRKITESSCGGQPTHVAPLPAADGGTVYLYQSDLWNDHERNQATAAQFWTPLEFTASGEISEISCDPYTYVPLQVSRSSDREQLTSSRFRLDCDLGPATPYGTLQRETRFVAQRSGRLRKLVFPLFRRGNPNTPLVVEVRQGEKVLGHDSIHAAALTWSSRRHLLATDVPVTAGEEYAVRFTASAESGCYGLAYYPDAVARANPQQWVTIDSGRSWFREEDRTLKLDLQIETD